MRRFLEILILWVVLAGVFSIAPGCASSHEPVADEANGEEVEKPRREGSGYQ
ncbi:MAG: hypothetical protein JSU88_05825 [Nitrospinaceae bacterium]|nr:MAG: hypothetical protein JSU88_05825 [Nitrospinaceae bacterium]